MKRDFYLVLSGFLSGILLSIILYRRRQRILERLNRIESKINAIETKNRVKSKVGEITAGIRKLLKSSKGVPAEEKEDILKKVEEKIRKLEEIV
ncbi:MAG: hypothetical protein GXN94_01270 [Aquificae bacterium]|nr:hypothetical protein [Aquificota bacterium]